MLKRYWVVISSISPWTHVNLIFSHSLCILILVWYQIFAFMVGVASLLLMSHVLREVQMCHKIILRSTSHHFAGMVGLHSISSPMSTIASVKTMVHVRSMEVQGKSFSIHPHIGRLALQLQRQCWIPLGTFVEQRLHYLRSSKSGNFDNLQRLVVGMQSRTCHIKHVSFLG